MSTPPRPSWLLILNAVAVITACVVLFAYFAWVIATKNSPLLVLGSPLMLCVPLLIAAMQYRAVFRHSEHAARHVGKYLFIAGGLLAIFFAMLSFIFAANEKGIDYGKIEITGALTVGCVYLLYCGHTNRLWAKQLQQWEEENAAEENTLSDV
jgi:hypothetical protein